MYESPIMAMVSDITTEMRHEQDREIMNAILSVGISVDKDELVKALSYDRQQYGKGYAEGYAAAQADTPRWISVEERLPEPYQNVLTCAWKLFGADRRLVYGIDYTLDNGEWACGGESYKTMVTHWMPLPSTEGLK